MEYWPNSHLAILDTVAVIGESEESDKFIHMLSYSRLENAPATLTNHLHEYKWPKCSNYYYSHSIGTLVNKSKHKVEKLTDLVKGFKCCRNNPA